MHIPVLCNEVIEGLDLKPGMKILDCTLGSGGHAEQILKRIQPGGLVIAIDQDSQAIELVKQRLADFKEQLVIVNENFRNIDKILASLGVEKINGAVFDLGVSSEQLDAAGRGFAIRLAGPLDMRMDKAQEISAYELVNRSHQDQLSRIFKELGEERFHRRIARAIVEKRRKKPIGTTKELAELIVNSVPKRGYQKIHPATRVFQALRIAVNNELESLEIGLDACVRHLQDQARICVISYHSLEDRIVKNKFKDYKKQEMMEILTKKPIVPSETEVNSNPRSRSAKLRIAQRRIIENAPR